MEWSENNPFENGNNRAKKNLRNGTQQMRGFVKQNTHPKLKNETSLLLLLLVCQLASVRFESWDELQERGVD